MIFRCGGGGGVGDWVGVSGKGGGSNSQKKSL